MKQILFLAFCLALRSFADEPAPAGAVYTGEAAKIQAQLEGLFDASKKVNDKAKNQRDAARSKIEGAMDWERVAQDCLGQKEWKKTNPGSRNTYRELLKDVVVKTAYTRLDTFWDGASYRFSKIDVKGDTAIATAQYAVKTDRFAIDYYLLKKGSNWMIYDIAFEDMRYSENIREQITAFLKDKGFSNLIAKLKKRREELEQGAKEDKAS